MGGPIDPWPWKAEGDTEYPLAETCRLLDFEKADVVPGIVSGTWFAVVSGSKPSISMSVQLVPRYYAKRPEYWEIEVVACLNGVNLPATGQYIATLPLDDILGTKGIEIVGAKKRKTIDVPN